VRKKVVIVCKDVVNVCKGEVVRKKVVNVRKDVHKDCA
jgi:hypothetical protein